ncbi:MAG: YggS family pyridoxal phosphate-dependent enzyme [Bacteroidetes bacterium]|jgi:PLP dependent protein|nr:YggS family pyridoxal phosphate-dependent enzyme [Bacteroidota bacterium]
MPVNIPLYTSIRAQFEEQNVTLVAVSKTKPNEDIMALYELGQRDFGENYVQELVAKQQALPADIRWHFIGHLQSNKVKMIAPFVHLIHGVDSNKLLLEINKQGAKLNRNIGCLLQVYIAKEDSKFGLDESEILEIASIQSTLHSVSIRGMMGMASFTTDTEQVRREFSNMYAISKTFPFATDPIISMGMSNDYPIAIEEGSNMVRIGSLLFGSRQ